MGNADAGIRSLERIADIEPLNKQAELEVGTNANWPSSSEGGEGDWNPPVIFF